MVDDEMNYLGGEESNTSITEDEIGLKLVFIIAAAVIALATVAFLPGVAQIIAFVVIFKWLNTKIFC